MIERGRPKQLSEVTEAYRAETEANRRTLIEIRDNKQNSPDARIRAVIPMEDRAWGKPIQATLTAESSHSEAFLEFLRSIDGESRRLPGAMIPMRIANTMRPANAASRRRLRSNRRLRELSHD
jgi:hypothetical protein